MTSPAQTDSSALRLTILVVIAGCLLAALFARLTFLQVINAHSGQVTATGNGLRQIFTTAPRGDILDRNGQILVGNRTSEVIEVQRQQAAANPSMKGRLATLIGMTPGQLDKIINNSRYSPYAPVPVLPDASPEQILYVQENQRAFPGVKATTETLRSYTPAGKAAANVVGYVGAINSSEYAKLKNQGYQPGDQIGLAGVESSYESILRGSPGVETVTVNSRGDVLGVASSKTPVAGANIKLTIDGNVQMAAETALEQGEAAARGSYDGVTHENFKAPGASAVVENPQDGTVVALATNPTYNPADFVGGISQAKYAAYRDPSAHDPLLDRTIQGQYAPGSTFKLVTATAALQAGLITPTSYYQDNGKIKIGNQTFKNDQGEVLGSIDLQTAITRSSDIYFNQLGATFWNMRGTLGPDALQNVARAYGFASPTGIKLPDEAAGKIPDPASVAADKKRYPKAFLEGNWFTGDSAQVAIGQFEDLVTPLQLANAYSTFANGGTRYQPRLVLDAETPTGQVLQGFGSAVTGHVNLAPDQRAAMLAGFNGAVNSGYGTAHNVFGGSPLRNMDIAGKTGTAQNSQGIQSTSVFTSFAPTTNPVYEVTAFMEQAGYGASVAGPVVRQIYDNLYHLPSEPISSMATSPGQT